MPTKPNTPYPRQAVRSQLIVTTRPEVLDVSALVATARDVGGVLVPLFGVEPQRLRENAARLRVGGIAVPDLSVFHEVIAPVDRFDSILRSLRRQKTIVTGAYIKRPADAPLVEVIDCADATCALGPPPAAPPSDNFIGAQLYLGRGPKGIDARYAWTQPGGTGKDVDVIDVEREWLFTHEDLLGTGGCWGGLPIGCVRERNHGTAVLGILRGDDNASGVMGIAPGSRVRGVSTRGQGVPEQQIPPAAATSAAIYRAADVLTNFTTQLYTGHIILLELRRPGPTGSDLPVEWWWDDWNAIRYATGLGLVVVEAAANGGTDLDSNAFDTPDPGFPTGAAGWHNPLRRGVSDCGAILVGAGSPPYGPWPRDRSRLPFSNYGSCVDVQGWGQEVFTTGFGCSQGGPEERWYTASFGGTSAASAMVAGALACVQGHLRATGAALLDWQAARTLLRTTGWKQTSNLPNYPSSQRIGRRPDLRQMLDAAESLATRRSRARRQAKSRRPREKPASSRPRSRRRGARRG
jgi:hypothetical protein